jgi:hypothetical protein
MLTLYIEEKYKVVTTDNSFLKNPYHSILPFILINSKEIHRMCLSDYEIKQVNRQFEKKRKSDKLEYYDFYRRGLIYFYRGEYFFAFQNFKFSQAMLNNLSQDDIAIASNNINKWLAFTGIIILFCQDNGKISQIDFTKIRNANLLNDDFEKNNSNSNSSSMFSCCTSRKPVSKSINKIPNLKANTNFSDSPQNSESIDSTSKVDTISLAHEIEEAIGKLKNNEKNCVEGWWIQMYISIYCSLNPDQKLFKKKNNPKYCVKKIKQLDNYISYIAYAELNYIVDPFFRIDEVLSELIFKFKNRVEAYLKYWQLLAKKGGNFYNYKKAHSVSEIFWKNCPSIKFDNIYYIYVVISHSKAAYYIGNSIYSITFYQKEYLSNLLYPSLFYLVIY